MVPRIGRRVFVQSSMASAALGILPAARRLPGFRRPPSERITIGIIGCGRMAGDYHLPELLNQPDTQVVAVCDVDRNRREAARKRVDAHYSSAKTEHRSCAAFSDFRELLADSGVDAVCIATPDHWHALQLIAACRSGRDVYCEKPLTLTIREAELSVATARRYRRIVQTGSQQRSNVFGRFREAVELVRSGRLGKISRVTVGVGAPSKPCDLPGEAAEPGLDWELWQGPAPAREYHPILSPRGVHSHFPAWRNYREYSGGGHTDMGAHHYDIALWALGLDGSGPVEITPPHDGRTDSGVRFRFENGVEFEHGGPGGCVFHGENGSLHIDRGVLESSPKEIAEEPLGAGDFRLPATPSHHRNWLDCILSRELPVADVELGARTVTTIHLGNLAYWHRKTLRWDPVAWRFSDPADNRLLDCDRHDPWQLDELDKPEGD